MRALLKIAAWGLAAVAPFLFMVWIDSWFDATEANASNWKIAKANVVHSRQQNLERLPASNWKAVSLPHHVAGDGQYPTSAWFSLDVPYKESGTSSLWAVFITADRTNYVVYVNGQLIGPSGRVTAPVPQYTTPQWFTFPASLLNATTNRIDIQVVRDFRSAVLPPVYVGPADALRPAFELRSFLDSGVKKVSVACMLTLAFMMAALFLMHTQDAAFGWFSLALIAWAAFIAIRITPVPAFHVPYLWVNLQNIAMGAYLVCTAFFVHRFLGISRKRLEVITVVWFAVGAAVLVIDPLFLGYKWPSFFGKVWFRPLLWLGIYLTWLLIRSHRAQSGFESGLLAMVAWFELVVGVRDGLIANGWIAEQPYYLTYTVGPVLFAFAVMLLRRFIRALREVEMARDQLEVQVAQRSAELAKQVVRLKDLEREAALNAERERLVREMHDGIGGHLVQALLMTGNRPDQADLKSVLERCLLELRLIVDSTDPSNDNLATALGSLRVQLTRALRDTPFKLSWSIDNSAAMEGIAGPRVLGILRIVQEALTNALKHSRASEIAVRVSTQERVSSLECKLTIEIEDNGVGIAASTGSGRGVRNMEQRATEVNAALAIHSSTTGTRVCLELEAELMQPNPPRPSSVQAQVAPSATPTRDPSGLTPAADGFA